MSKVSIFLDMDDVPHLSDKEKQAILSAVPPWQRQARKSGIPGQGVGSIYPIAERDMVCHPYEIPSHWLHSYGMDPGWNCTAVIWFAWDPDFPDHAVAYQEYYKGQADPAVHAAAIIAKGRWIPGVIDPAAQKARGHDGERLLQVYRDLGLNVTMADNTVVSGLMKCWDGLSTQKLRIFSTLENWKKEARLYRRDEKGEIIKKNDHLMDAMRYNYMSGRAVAITRPESTGPGWARWDPAMATPGGIWIG